MGCADLIGIPYQEHGRTLSGSDCMGIVYLFNRKLGKQVPDYRTEYASSIDPEAVNQVVEQHQSEWLEVEEPEVGDLLLFCIRGWPVHVGVYIGGNRFLHSLKGCNSCIERLNSITWNRRLKKVLRWVGN